MVSPLFQNYKAFIIGGIISFGLVIMLSGAGLVILSPDNVSLPLITIFNVLCIGLTWLFISFLIHKYSVAKVLGVAGLLVGAGIVEYFMKIPINPITISLLVLFWIGVAYLILPQFFEKYKVVILSVYGAVLSYFLIFRMMPNYLEDHHQNFLRFLLIPVPVFVGLWVYEQWRWLKMLKTDKAKAELSLLRNQINPHFFFNTLNNLYGLTVEKSDQAPEMILKLSDIMRYTIYEGNADYVALKDELTYLEDYIELHKIRYQKKVAIAIQKDIQHSHQIAPLLLVIPLENAFKHGVESLVANAFINMDVSTTPTSISFQISNNFEPKLSDREGIGLQNLKQRLALIYPNQHQLEISNMADVYTVSIEINSL